MMNSLMCGDLAASTIVRACSFVSQLSRGAKAGGIHSLGAAVPYLYRKHALNNSKSVLIVLPDYSAIAASMAAIASSEFQ